MKQEQLGKQLNSRQLKQQRDFLAHTTRSPEVVRLWDYSTQHHDNVIKSPSSIFCSSIPIMLVSFLVAKKKKKKKAVVVQVSHLSSPLSKLKNGTSPCVSFKELQNASQKPQPPASPTSPWTKWPLPKPVTVRERNFLHWFSVINHPHLGLGTEPAFSKAHGSLAKGGILEEKTQGLLEESELGIAIGQATKVVS